MTRPRRICVGGFSLLRQGSTCRHGALQSGVFSCHAFRVSCTTNRSAQVMRPKIACKATSLRKPVLISTTREALEAPQDGHLPRGEHLVHAHAQTVEQL